MCYNGLCEYQEIEFRLQVQWQQVSDIYPVIVMTMILFAVIIIAQYAMIMNLAFIYYAI